MKKIILCGIALSLVLLTACSNSKDMTGDEPNTQETDITPADTATEKESDYSAFLSLLTENGFEYSDELQDDAVDSFLSVRRQAVFIDDEIISIYQYDSSEDMEQYSSYISKDGFGINGPNQGIQISWISIPYFFKKDTLIINYVGENEQIIDFLTENYGAPFAGGPQN